MTGEQNSAVMVLGIQSENQYMKILMILMMKILMLISGGQNSFL